MQIFGARICHLIVAEIPFQCEVASAADWLTAGPRKRKATGTSLSN